MITVVARPNAFEPHSREIFKLEAGTTIRQAIAAADFDTRQPIIAGVDGDWWLRTRWDEPLPDGAHVQAVGLVAGGGNNSTMTWVSVAEIVVGAVLVYTGYGAAFGYALIVAGAAGLASSLLLGGNSPHLPSALQGESGSPTYALDMQNRKRMGEPISVLYGRHRLVPDLVAAPYADFENDDQYIFEVLCLGQGHFSIEDLRIADADLNRLQNLTYEFVLPGGTLTLFRDHVTTSTIVQGQTLLPTNDVSKVGNPTITIALFGGNWRVTASVVGIFGSHIGVGTNVVLSNCVNAGTWFVSATDGLTWFESGGMQVESPKAAGVSSSFGTLIPAGDVFFSHATHTIYDPTFKRFAGWRDDEGLTISNSTLNNGTYTIVSVAADGSSAVVVENINDESGANPTFALSSGGWVGPFPVNAYGTTLLTIGVDLVFPKGLTNNGNSYSVTVQFDAREIDVNGAPVGGWVTLAIETVTRTSFAPVRRSFEYPKPTGGMRWEVRAKRTTSGQHSINVLEDCAWAGLRGYLPQIGTYPNVTVLAIQVRASEQIPADVARQINVVATRLLPTCTVDSFGVVTWGPEVATRNPAWALADLLRNSTYGAGLPDSRIDLAKLAELAATWEARGDYFDGVFDQTVTIWEAAQRIARVGRAIPVLVGGVITFVRDDVRPLRTAIFTPAHMVKGSFGIDYALKKEEDPDGVEVSYIDPNTWQTAHLSASVDGHAPVRPASVDLFGVTDPAHALREALYLARSDAYQRKIVHFNTELDGHIPNLGDRIVISHDVPSWGQSGHIIGWTNQSELLTEDGIGLDTEDGESLLLDGPSTVLVQTTEALVFTPDVAHYLALRRPNGSVSGPYLVTAVAGDDHACLLVASVDFTPRIDLSQGDRTAYVFGPSTSLGLDLVVTRITPRDEHTVEISCQPYDVRLYAAGV